MHKQFQQKHHFFWCNLTSLNTVFPVFIYFLVFTTVCLLTVGVEVILAPNHTHPVGLLWTSDQPTQRPLPDNKQHWQQRETSMPPAGLEPAIAASERPQTHALDRAATGTG
jgi:hypothetical protein